MLILAKSYFKQEELLNPDGGAGGGAPPPAGGTPPAAPASFDWGKVKESLPEDIRNDPSFSPITSLEGLAKSFVHAQKAIGKEKVVVPDKHATEDDWKGVFTKLGNPEKFEDYSIDTKDLQIEESIFNKVKATAHAKGVLPWQFEAIVRDFSEAAKGLIDAEMTQATSTKEAQVNELKKAWGEKFEDEVRNANVAMRHFLPNADDQRALIEAGFGTNPAAIRLLANAAKVLSEDAFVGQGTRKPGGMTSEDALKKAREIQGNMSHPYRDPTHPNHKAAKEEVQNLYKIAYPE